MPPGQAEGHRPPEGQGLPKRPERRFTILLLSTAVFLGFVGTLEGALMLANLAGAPTDVGLSLFPGHPFVQIFGFVTEFVMGVGYSLLPRFKVGRFPRVSLAYGVYGAMTSANVIFLLSPIVGDTVSTLPLASLLMLGGSLIFAYQVASVAKAPTGGFPEVNPLLVLSPVSLVLATTLVFLDVEGAVNLQGGVFSPQLVFLTLIGFAGSEIYAVQIRSVSFRQCDYRKRMAQSSSILQAAAVATTFLDSILPGIPLSIATAGLFLTAAIAVLLSTKVLELAHPLMLRPAMTRMHYTIMRYNEVCMLSASAWLLIGCILGIAWLGFGVGTFTVRDSFIHSIAIGFVGADITCFAPMLLPGLLGRKGPITGLSYWPIALLDLGVLVRIGGNLQSLGGSGLPIWESASGPIILIAMVWFLFMLKGVGTRRPEAAKPQNISGSDESSWRPLDSEIDVSLETTSVLGGAKPISVWFAEKDGLLYSLPNQGIDTPWYIEVVKNPRVSISTKGRKVNGNASPVRDPEQVKRIIRLFKDKYGQRNFENYVGNRANVGVKIVLDSGLPGRASSGRGAKSTSGERTAHGHD